MNIKSNISCQYQEKACHIQEYENCQNCTEYPDHFFLFFLRSACSPLPELHDFPDDSCYFLICNENVDREIKLPTHESTVTSQCPEEGEKPKGQQYEKANHDVDVRINYDDSVCCDGESPVSSPGEVTWTTFTTPTPAMERRCLLIVNFSRADKLKHVSSLN